MKKTKWALVGIGKLGQAILHQFDQLEQPAHDLYIYHPDFQKARHISSSFKHSEAIDLKQLWSVDSLILALPPQHIEAFMHDLKQEVKDDTTRPPTLINMATSTSTAELSKTYPDFQWVSMKFMGHAQGLKQGQALFVADEGSLKADPSILAFFKAIGQVIFDKESVVQEVNRMATYYAIKAAKELEQEMEGKGYRKQYQQQALEAMSPYVMMSYSKGALGHFGKKIAEQLVDNEPSLDPAHKKANNRRT